MTDADRFAHLSPLKRAFLAIEELQSTLDRVEHARREPIAIVGIGCRFPGGANDPEAFWRLLRDGVDTVGTIPPERWDRDAWFHPDPDAPGKMATRQGAFLERVDAFDAGFFNISPREAAGLDPQQRLLLEVAWESMEHAAIAPARLAGTRTGVFVGVMTKDYALLGDPLHRPDAIDAYTGTGTEDCFAAGRVSYTFGLQGPSLTIETACSSSLVALHLACQSLRAGESDVALAAGVGLILTPAMHVITSKVRALSPDGRCKTFDASADGYGRGEGCGVLVLKRLSSAQADGDRVLALVRGSAVNHDGASGGLTVPNGPAQQALIRQALERAGVAARDVSYVEAHGTGTPLGDPIEIGALGAVLGAGRADGESFLVGSVKTNIGHLEAAAGVAGVIKVVLSMLHGEIPPHLHFHTPNPHLSLAAAHAAVPAVLTPWTPPARRIAGVSSFGISGTNAHVVLEEAPAAVEAEGAASGADRPAHLLTLAARSPQALDALRARLAAHLTRQPDLPLGDVCATAFAGRTHFAHRLAVVADSTAALQRQLAAGAGRRGHVAAGAPPRLAFLFPGQGAQWSGMGRQLYDLHPVVRAVLEHCDARTRDRLPRPLLTLLFDPAAAPLLARTDCTQPAVYALQVALAALWRHAGVAPALVCGHSVGELAAAHVAGLLSLDDGLDLAVERGRLMAALPRPGAMVAVLAPEADVRAWLRDGPSDLAIAALNGPRETVVSGAREAVAAFTADLTRRGAPTRPLRVAYGFHSPLMDPMLDAWEQCAAAVPWQPARLPLVAARTGTPVTTLTARDLRAQAREPVRFADALQTLARAGCRLFVEVGPGTTLTALGPAVLEAPDVAFLPTLRKSRAAWPQLLDTAGALYTRGVALDLPALDPHGRRRRVALPTYPFERTRFWLPAPTLRPAHAAAVAPSAGERSPHPLLGVRLRTAQDIFESRIAPSQPGYLADHSIAAAAVFPAAGYLELAHAAGAAVFGSDRPVCIEQVRLVTPLVLGDASPGTLQTVVDPIHDAAAAFRIFSLREDGDGSGGTHAPPTWTLHATGSLRALDTRATAGPYETSPGDHAGACPIERAPDDHYARFAASGLDFGPAFRVVTSLRLGPDRAHGILRLPDSLSSDAGRYSIHPVMLDGALQILGAAMAEHDGANHGGDLLRIPTAVGRLSFHASGGQGARCEARITARSADGGCSGSLRLFDESGSVLVEIEDLESQRVPREAVVPSAPAPWTQWLYDVRWVPRSLLERPARHHAASLRAPHAIAEALAPRLVSIEDGLELYDDVDRELDAAAAHYAAAALLSLGLGDVDAPTPLPTPTPGRGLPKHLHRLVERLRQIAAGCSAPSRGTDPAARLERLIDRASAYRAEIDLVRTCGANLAGVLSGSVDPLQLLFPDGAVEGAATLYQDSPMARAANLLVAAAAAEAIAAHADGRPLRVLEIGGGTGGTTFHLLPRLPHDCTEYVFTDVGAGFLSRAERRFRGFAGFRTQVLDIELDPAAQGIAAGTFDLVVAANVLHATIDLRRALAHARVLLAPGGLLLVLEGTAPRPWVDLVFGMTQGWWRFADADLRPSHPLLARARWETLLAEAGFDAVALPGTQVLDRSWWRHQAVFAARAPLAGAAQPRPPAIVTPRGMAERSPAWLVLGDRGGIGRRLASRLRARGESCRLVYAAADDGPDGDALDPLDADAIATLVRQFIDEGPEAPREIVHLWGLDLPDAATMTADALEAFQSRALGGALHVVQGAASAAARPRVHVVTRGAAAIEGESPTGFAAAALWGFARVLGLEHPELRGALIDLDPSALDAIDDAVLDDELHRSGEPDHVAWRSGQRRVARLWRRSVTPARSARLRLRSHGTWLITGGLKGLGLATARFLVDRGARSLVLAGRAAPSHEALAEIDAMTALGARVAVARLDVSQRREVRAVVDGIRRDGPPLCGIVHSAGFLEDGLLAQQPWPRFQSVLGPKIDGAFHLHTETLDDPIEHFLLYSSTAGVLGSPGQANHAAANAFLDALAQYRRAIGRPANSIAWGAWSEIGSAARPDVAERLLARGIGPIGTRSGLAVLERLFDDAAACSTVLAADWPIYLAAFQAGQAPPLLAALALEAETTAPPDPSHGAGGILRRIAAALPGERPGVLAEYVHEAVLKVLGRAADDVLPPDQGFQELGLDSLMALELRNMLQGSLGLALPSTLALNYPSVESLTANLATRLSIEPLRPGAEPAAHVARSGPPSAAVPVDGLNDLLADVLSLSEEEARSALRRRP